MPAPSPAFLKLCHLADESGLTVDLEVYGTAAGPLWVLIAGTEEKRVSAQAHAHDIADVLGGMADAILDTI